MFSINPPLPPLRLEPHDNHSSPFISPSPPSEAGGSILGVRFLDPLAGLVVSGMILRAGLETGYQRDADTLGEGELVDPLCSVSIAHQIGVSVRYHIQNWHPEVSEVFIHLEPSNKLFDVQQQEENRIEEMITNMLSSNFSQVMAINESSRLCPSITTENVPVKILVHQILTPSTSDSNFCAMKRRFNRRGSGINDPTTTMEELYSLLLITGDVLADKGKRETPLIPRLMEVVNEKLFSFLSIFCMFRSFHFLRFFLSISSFILCSLSICSYRLTVLCFIKSGGSGLKRKLPEGEGEVIEMCKFVIQQHVRVVYTQLLQSDPTSLDKCIDDPPKASIHSFYKVLTASDTSIHGGFQCSENTQMNAYLHCIFVQDMSQPTPTQELVAKDLHGTDQPNWIHASEKGGVAPSVYSRKEPVAN
ncbi:unnamed protein product [Lactuca virosa]|uniref:Uncharacterized protein n=1 Tax=Lactuca virosa TaxID=75947 RepID=A0AAU9N161_9ASTR|nr:unnamed protein product [Lactuca virosa]